MFWSPVWTLPSQRMETVNSTFLAVYHPRALACPRRPAQLSGGKKSYKRWMFFFCESWAGPQLPVQLPRGCSVCLGVSSGDILGNTLRSNYIVCNMLIGHLHSCRARRRYFKSSRLWVMKGNSCICLYVVLFFYSFLLFKSNHPRSVPR